MLLNKKAQGFVEASAIVILILGIIVSILSKNKTFSYVIISLCGVLFGRLLYEQRKNLKWAFYLVIAGFLVGYLIGNYYASALLLVVLFIVFIAISYVIHLKKII